METEKERERERGEREIEERERLSREDVGDRVGKITLSHPPL